CSWWSRWLLRSTALSNSKPRSEVATATVPSDRNGTTTSAQSPAVPTMRAVIITIPAARIDTKACLARSRIRPESETRAKKIGWEIRYSSGTVATTPVESVTPTIHPHETQEAYGRTIRRSQSTRAEITRSRPTATIGTRKRGFWKTVVRTAWAARTMTATHPIATERL